VLEHFSGDTLLGHIVERVKRSKYINHVLVATGNESTNAQLIAACKKQGIETFCGSDEDVLSRFYFAAKPLSPGIIVRITADDPLKDPEVIDRAIEILLQSQYDYVSNTLKPTYPEGLDIETFTFAALDRAFHEAKLLSEREHVTPYIWKNLRLFRTHNFEYSTDLSHLRWTVDYAEDMDFVKKIYRHFEGKGYFGMQDILQFLAQNPGLSRTNQDVERNQAYNQMVKHEQ